jgi:hypothetical protein
MEKKQSFMVKISTNYIQTEYLSTTEHVYYKIILNEEQDKNAHIHQSSCGFERLNQTHKARKRNKRHKSR